MEKDVMLRSRMTAKQMEVLDQIVAELQAQTPEANVSTSSVARYALESYVDRHIAKRDKTKIFSEINISDFTKEDISLLYKSFNEMCDRVKSTGNVTVFNALVESGFAIMQIYADSIRMKKEA